MKSLWLDEALAAEGSGNERTPPLEGTIRADVCIVGGGYTGLWTAIRLKELEPSVDVVLLEADRCGSGASGRNGGFVLSWWAKFATLAKACGSEEALRLARASGHAVAEIGAFCEANAIDARFHHDGYLWAATNAAQVGSWRTTMDVLERHGEQPFRELAPEEVRRRTGSPMHLAGVVESSAAIVQPALLARGLRRVALERGVRIHERSPMARIGRSPRAGAGGRWVRTPRGAVRANRVVLATNAWTARFAELRKRIVVVGSDIVATVPIPEQLAEIGWTDGLCIADSRLLVHYYRTTDDGRIAFGKGGGAIAFGRWVGRRFDGPSRRRGHVAGHLRRLYPSLGTVPIAATWTGPIDRSKNGLPFFGPLGLGPDVLVGVGYSGNGVGPSYLGGRVLASLALQRDDEWAGCGLVGPPAGRFPPEPFRFVGGTVVKAAITHQERTEDRGRAAGALTRRLVALAPAGLLPVKGEAHLIESSRPSVKRDVGPADR